jgi:hypothetical protein
MIISQFIEVKESVIAAAIVNEIDFEIIFLRLFWNTWQLAAYVAATFSPSLYAGTPQKFS